MKQNTVLRKRAILKRLIFTFVIIIIPIYFMGAGIYSWGINTVRKEITNSARNQAENYLDKMETEIQRIKKLQYDCTADEDINRLANLSELMTGIEKTQAILRIQNRLVAIMSSSRYIKDVWVHIPKLNKSISARDGISQYLKTQMDKLIFATADNDSQLLFDNKVLWLSTGYKMGKMAKVRIPSFMITIELSNSAIEKTLFDQFSAYEGSQAALINRAQGFNIGLEDSKNKSAAMADIEAEIAREGDHGTLSVRINNERFLVVNTYSQYLGMNLMRVIPEKNIFSPLQSFQVLFLVFSLLSIFIIFIYAVSTYQFIHKPLVTLVDSFQKVEKGELDFKIEHNYQDEFRYLYHRFNGMVEKLNILITQVYTQKILAQKAELKQLQSQISPHFIYNTFCIMHSMAQSEGCDSVTEFSKQVGAYFKYITRSAADEVPLQREVEHARIYAEIQRMRFGSRVSIHFAELPHQYNDIIVSRLIIQPIIENAFEHGLKKMPGQGKILSVTFSEHDKYLSILVENNGVLIDRQSLLQMEQSLENHANECEVTAICNIHRRLQLKFGGSSGLQFLQGENGGLKVIIKIHLERQNDVPIIDCG